jgi:hypothetical protein
MKNYLVATQLTASENITRTFSLNLLGTSVTSKQFDTYEQALEYANSLQGDSMIYKAYSEIKIKHEETKINENTDNTSSEQDKVS